MVLLGRNRRRTTITPQQSQAHVVCRERKLMVVGQPGIGKLALTIRFIDGRFVPEFDPTIPNSYKKQLVVDDEAVLVDIFSDYPNDDGPRVSDSVLRRSDSFLFVYSITERWTFNEIRTLHERILRTKGRDAPAAIIIGNKCDLEAEREVSMQEGRDLAEELGCAFIETSAKQNINVEEAFFNVIRQIPRSNKSKPGEPQDVQTGGEGEHGSRCSGCVVF
ncbi:ras-like protein [Mycena sanguinolenta]|nr:ras-like protein [Mycena sanguinolenta]